jgi:hypothetical protein
LLSQFYHILEVFNTLFQNLGDVRVLSLALGNRCSCALLLIRLVIRKIGVLHQSLVVVLHVQPLRLGEIYVVRLA